MIRVGISGANGTMGRLTISAIDAVGGLYAPGGDGQEILGYSASSDPGALSECDVVIELTNPSASDENVPRWRDSGADVLIGTSGYTTVRQNALRDAWPGLTSRCLVVLNFAIGAVLMIHFAELASPHFESAEIVEMHHHSKPDAPFGTVGQYLTFRHDTTDYQCFAPGILLALREIHSLDAGVTVGLENLLGV